MNRINMHIEIYSMIADDLFVIIRAHPMCFDELIEFSTRVDKIIHKVNEWKNIRDAIRRPSR